MRYAVDFMNNRHEASPPKSKKTGTILQYANHTVLGHFHLR